MRATLKEVTRIAEELDFTIRAFSTHNLEVLPAMLGTAKEVGSPIIIQISVDTTKYIGMHASVNVMIAITEEEMVDVVLHLDHARDFNDTKEATDSRYTSVMYDGSHLSFRGNILKTRAMIEYARAHGVSVEGELGTIGGTEEGIHVTESDKVYTRPEDAAKSAEVTDVDALAIATGTNHGQSKSKAKVNIPLLKEIDAIVDVPLIIHDGTGVEEEDHPELINNKIRKFNVGTELLVNWTKMAKETFSETEINRSLRHNMISVDGAVKETVKHKIGLFMNLESPINLGNK